MNKFVSLCLAAVMTLAAFTLVFPTERVSAVSDIIADFAKYQNGIVDRKNNATVSTHSHNGVNCAIVTAKPTASDSEKPVNIDSYSWSSLIANGVQTAVPLNTLKYVTITYRYDGQTKTLGRPRLVFLPSGDKAFASAVTVESYEEKLTSGAGSWQTLTFDVEGAFDGKLISTVNLKQMHFYPYGSVAASSLDAFDFFHFSEIKFGYGVPENKKYSVTFEKGFAKAYLPSGRSNGNTFVAAGTEFVLPECPFERDGFEFNGWVSWHENTKYSAGDTVTVNSDEVFTADWIAKTDYSTNDFIICNATNYLTGRIDASKGNPNHGVYTKNATFDGVKSLYKFTPDTSITNTGAKIDSWGFETLNIDIKDYHYLSVVYYYKSKNPASAKWQWRFLSNGGIATSSSNYTLDMTANRWAVMNIDFTSFSNKATVTSDGTNDIRQLHINPFYDVKMSDLDPDDELYIGKMIFTKEQMNCDVTDAIFSVTSEGLVRPDKYITRGEAYAAAMRISGMEPYALSLEGESSFADVGTDSKYNKYFLLLELAGYFTPSSGEKIYPDSPVTRNEVLELLSYNMTNGDTSLQSVGSIDAPHNGGYMTRREFVRMISGLIKPDASKKYAYTGIYSLSFPDVPSDSIDAEIYPVLSVRGITVPDKGLYVSGLNATTDTAVDEVRYAEGNAYIKQLDTVSSERISEIRNTGNTYYDKYVADSKTFGNVIFVSHNGSDTNNGKTPETAIKSLSKLASLNSSLKAGDAVFFERGGVYRETGAYSTVAGVTYSSYGTGAKPEIWGAHFDLANTGSWSFYGYSDNGGKIWRYSDNITDCGALFLMKGGEVVTVAAKEIPSYFDKYNYTTEAGSVNHTPWRTRGSVDTPFIVKTELDNDLEYVNLADSSRNYYKQETINGETVTLYLPGASASGPLYFRCDAGNPADVYDEIEYAARHNGFGATSGVTRDNLTFKFIGCHAIGAGTVTNLSVTNCEIGWVGGAIQHYNASNTNAGRVTRFGNGIEIYGGLYNYLVDNCYIYEVYDAGVTHQYSSGGSNSIYMQNVDYTNNVLEYSTYNIEYFAGSALSGSGAIRKMKDILFENNIIRLAGYGWGQQRPDPAPAGIKGWSHNNMADGFIIRNNIIDRSTHMLMQLGSVYATAAPYLVGNTYVQHCGSDYAYYFSSYLGRKETFKYDANIRNHMRLMDEDNATVYFTEPIEWKHIYVYHRDTVPGTY